MTSEYDASVIVVWSVYSGPRYSIRGSFLRRNPAQSDGLSFSLSADLSLFVAPPTTKPNNPFFLL